MKRPIKPEELRLWSMVAATVHPLPGRHLASTHGEGQPARGGPRGEVRHKKRGSAGDPPSPTPTAARSAPPHQGEGKAIEPRRKHRIAKERDPIGGRIDLHGMTYDQARTVLEGFLRRAWDEGYRAVLVITGKGLSGDGILRRATPEWLAAPALAHIVAGISEAHRRHGGEGALYVALKRKARA